MTPEDLRIRALRPPRPVVDPWRPVGTLLEDERLPGGGCAPAFTVFLAGAECPFTCVFCDLWRFTLDGPTPRGALPAQLELALAELDADPEKTEPEKTTLKLYNASNFFDRRAVPPDDDEQLLELVSPFARVVVENHPRLLGQRADAWASRLAGRLEVAMGLETVHPAALAKLNKKSTVEDFDRATTRLSQAGAGLRAFVLLGTPFVPPAERLESTRRSVVHALERGARHVTVVPLRGGNGEMDRLERLGLFVPPTLEEIEDALDGALERAIAGGGVVTVDLWDLERFASCTACFAARRIRLERLNLGIALETPRIRCAECGAG